MAESEWGVYLYLHFTVRDEALNCHASLPPRTLVDQWRTAYYVAQGGIIACTRLINSCVVTTYDDK